MNIKALMVLGALVGFASGIGFGVADGNPWPVILWRSSAAALISAILTRWWGRIWANSLRDALRQRQHQPAPTAVKTPVKP